MRIIVDVMSGDNAPLELLKGVCAASQELNANFILTGDRDVIVRLAAENGLDIRRFEISDTKTVITMEDPPISVVRGKSDSSMSVGLSLLAQGRGDAFVSAGNSGALFTGASLIVRKIKGVQRAAIAALLPFSPPVMLLDSGANLVVTEEQLEQFAIMGSSYMRDYFGVENPRVGLLNNGTEDCKGTELQIAAYRRLSDCAEINFVGNVEANSIEFDVCDVVVADGYSGNILLKSIEGMGKLLLGELKKVFTSTSLTKISALMVRGRISDIKRRYDPNEHGGAPILGISKPVIKAHGSSNAKAFKSAVFQAVVCVENGVTYDIARAAEGFVAKKQAQSETRHAAEPRNQNETEEEKQTAKL